MLNKLVILLIICSSICSSEKLKIDVLYESLCPDSLRFITEQLYPAWRDLSAHVDLNLIPFGKSSSINNGEDFVCQHGPQECKGNKIQSCALSNIKNQDHQVDFVNCFMKTYYARQNVEFGQTCSQQLGLDFETIHNCYKTRRGTELQLIAEKRTLKVLPKFVPTIIFNGVFDENLQEASLINFQGVVCGLIKKKSPDECKTIISVRK